MRTPERVTSEAWVHDDVGRFCPVALGEGERTAQERFIAFIRAKAHGVIWPSIVVRHERKDDITRISVRGLAFRADRTADAKQE